MLVQKYGCISTFIQVHGSLATREICESNIFVLYYTS